MTHHLLIKWGSFSVTIGVVVRILRSCVECLISPQPNSSAGIPRWAIWFKIAVLSNCFFELILDPTSLCLVTEDCLEAELGRQIELHQFKERLQKALRLNARLIEWLSFGFVGKLISQTFYVDSAILTSAELMLQWAFLTNYVSGYSVSQFVAKSLHWHGQDQWLDRYLKK